MACLICGLVNPKYGPMKENEKLTHCPLCKGDRHNPFLKGFDRLVSSKERKLSIRAMYGLSDGIPVPSSVTLDEINSFYGEDYGPHQSGGQGKIMKRHQNYSESIYHKTLFKNG